MSLEVSCNVFPNAICLGVDTIFCGINCCDSADGSVLNPFLLFFSCILFAKYSLNSSSLYPYVSAVFLISLNSESFSPVPFCRL